MKTFDMSDLGWSAHFARQFSDSDTQSLTPARVAAVHRDRVDTLGLSGETSVSLPPDISAGDIAVGDWILFNENNRLERILERLTVLTRRAAGTDARRQLIAANVGTLGIVTSCNDDFNIARIERYLVLATEAGALPLVILTKADLSTGSDSYRRQAERLSPLVTALALDARDPADLARLSPWCGPGETLALVGSSGVGKTTILNGLTGLDAVTQVIREDDAKGRHTTTARALRRTRFGGWIIDTPGMRALRLSDVSDGIETVFSDIEELSIACRFSDCSHVSEPGCAVRAALEDGRLDPDRLARLEKLRREDRRNSETLAEARSREKAFGKIVKEAQNEGRRKRGLT